MSCVYVSKAFGLVGFPPYISDQNITTLTGIPVLCRCLARSKPKQPGLLSGMITLIEKYSEVKEMVV